MHKLDINITFTTLPAETSATAASSVTTDKAESGDGDESVASGILRDGPGSVFLQSNLPHKFMPWTFK